ncbi:MAG: hypothetical protein V4591_05565 [Bdellovibrionota bacterium]
MSSVSAFFRSFLLPTKSSCKAPQGETKASSLFVAKETRETLTSILEILNLSSSILDLNNEDTQTRIVSFLRDASDQDMRELLLFIKHPENDLLRERLYNNDTIFRAFFLRVYEPGFTGGVVARLGKDKFTKEALIEHACKMGTLNLRAPRANTTAGTATTTATAAALDTLGISYVNRNACGRAKCIRVLDDVHDGSCGINAVLAALGIYRGRASFFKSFERYSEFSTVRGQMKKLEKAYEVIRSYLSPSSKKLDETAVRDLQDNFAVLFDNNIELFKQVVLYKIKQENKELNKGDITNLSWFKNITAEILQVVLGLNWGIDACKGYVTIPHQNVYQGHLELYMLSNGYVAPLFNSDVLSGQVKQDGHVVLEFKQVCHPHKVVYIANDGNPCRGLEPSHWWCVRL